MENALIAAAAVLLDFAAGYIIGRIPHTKKRGRFTSMPQTKSTHSLDRTMAEYRNFLYYDGTEQPDIE